MKSFEGYEGSMQAISGDTRIYSGAVVTNFEKEQLHGFAEQISRSISANPDYMRLSDADEILEGMQEGRFVVSVKQPLMRRHPQVLLATSHLRPSKRNVNGLELGGVLRISSESEAGGHAELVTRAGVRLATEGFGASSVEALVAVENEKAQELFRTRLGATDMGERDSDYVRRRGEPVIMTVFDVTNIAQR